MVTFSLLLFADQTAWMVNITWLLLFGCHAFWMVCGRNASIFNFSSTKNKHFRILGLGSVAWLALSPNCIESELAYRIAIRVNTKDVLKNMHLYVEGIISMIPVVFWPFWRRMMANHELPQTRYNWNTSGKLSVSWVWLNKFFPWVETPLQVKFTYAWRSNP